MLPPFSRSALSILIGGTMFDTLDDFKKAGADFNESSAPGNANLPINVSTS
jgi:hypothetical protein